MKRYYPGYSRLVAILISVLLSALFVGSFSQTLSSIENFGLSNHAPEVTLLSSKLDIISLTCETYGISFVSVDIGDEQFQKIKIRDCRNTARIGHPCIPYITRLIAVPECSEYKLEIIHGEVIEFENINIYPAEDLVSLENISREVYRDPDVYNTNAYYPQANAVIENTFKIRNQRVVELRIFPIRVNPVTNVALFTKDLSIKVINKNPVSAVNVSTGPFNSICQNALLNYSFGIGMSNDQNSRVLLGSSMGSVDSCTSLSSCNGTDYLIVVGDDLWEDTTANYCVMELARKRAEHNGYNVCVINLGSIIDPDSIASENADYLFKDELIDFYQSNQAEHMIDDKLGYILLVGDVYICSSDSCPPEDRTVIIPSHYHYDRDLYPAKGVTDIFYAALDSPEDISPDVFIGRISASDSLEVRSYIEKILAYEPHIRDDNNPWYNRVLFVGGDDDDFDGTNLGLAESYSNCEDYIPSYIQFDNVYYYNEPDPSDTVESLIEGGYLLTLYYGHGCNYYWKNGFYPRDYEDLANEALYPMIFAYSCETAQIDLPAYDGETEFCHPDTSYNPTTNCYSPAAPTEVDAFDCMAERITNISGRGAIGYIGFSRSEPIPGESDLDPNATFLRSFFNSDYAYIGEIAIDYYYCMEDGKYEYVILGDPALNIFSVENEDTTENCVDLMLKNDNLHFSSILDCGISDTLFCDVVNFGPDDADSVVVEVWADTTMLCSLVIDTIKASHYSTAKLPVSFNSIGNYDINIVVNPDSLITEYRYSNNQVDTITTVLDIKSGFPFALDVPDTVANIKSYSSCPVIDRFRSASYCDILINENGSDIKFINTSGTCLDAVSNCCMEHDAILPVGYISNATAKELCAVKVRPSYSPDNLIFSIYKWESLSWQLVDTLSIEEEISAYVFSNKELSCIHDVTNNGQLEILFCEGYAENYSSYSGKLFLLTYNNGISLCDTLSLDYKPLSIAVEDIDHDYYPEIVIIGLNYNSGYYMEISILEYDQGIQIEGEFSIDCGYISYLSAHIITGDVILSDVNNDKYLDIVAVLNKRLVICNGSSENYSTLYSGFIDDDSSFNASLCAGNIDTDEQDEIVVLRDDWIRTYDYDAGLSAVDTFEYSEGRLVSGPYIADLNNDDSNEIVFSTADNITEKYSIVILNSSLDNITEWNSLVVYNTMNGWSNNQSLYPQIALADLEIDGKIDLLLQTREEVYAINLPWAQSGEMSWPRPGCNSRINNCEKRFVRTLSDHDAGLHGIIEAWGDFGSDTTSTISIGPGTIISIDTLDMDSAGDDEDRIEFVVTGDILGRGNEIDPIIISSMIENEVGDWAGIIDDNTGSTSEYDYVTIDYSETAIESASPIELSHCTIDESNSQAFDLSNNASIDSSTIYLNSDHAIGFGDTFTVTGNTTFIIGQDDLADNYSYPSLVEFFNFGILNINGDASDRVEFKSVNASNCGGDWLGIIIPAISSIAANIKNCEISDAIYGIIAPKTISLRNVEITNCAVTGLYLSGSDNESTVDSCTFSYNDSTDASGIQIWDVDSLITIDSCQVNCNGYYGLWIKNSRPDITWTDVKYNGDDGINMGRYSSSIPWEPYIYKCDIRNNGDDGIYIGSCNGLIQHTKISNNETYGVYAWDSNAKFKRSEVDSQHTGFKVRYSAISIGDPSDTTYTGYCSIDNDSFNVVYNSPPTLNAEYCWWGASPPDSSKIDGVEKVNIANWLPSKPTNLYSSIFINEDSQIPTRIILYQNFPNPLIGGNSTQIKFSLPNAEKVNITVYDVAGRRVRTLVSGVKQPGHHYIRWDGHNDRGARVATGIYFYQMKVGRKVMSKKIVLIR